MKLLLLELLMFFQESQFSCDDFYKKELDPLAIEGKVSTKDIGEDFYNIFIVNDNGEKIHLRIIKNMAGFEIYNFIVKDSRISKKKGKRSIHVLTENKLDKSLKGKIFDKLCH
ncbi:hypothetical protein [Phocaeicola coprocola]|uniref:hypothetical protein n=1 Tax=Phocaeicola coprocola TaxID=310298 RepID=UPI00266F6A67|nr:hypothetical protein [Phocaeicola coprocola]